MKKLFSILTIVGLFVIFLAPVATAQTVPQEVTKCTMRHNLTGPVGCVTGSTDKPCWKDKGFDCPWSDTVPALRVCLFDSANTCGSCCLMDTIYTITDWIFIGIVSLVGIMILIGAFNIVTAGGSPEKVNTGRSFIILAVVGLIIALIAKLIPAIAKNMIGLG